MYTGVTTYLSIFIMKENKRFSQTSLAVISVLSVLLILATLLIVFLLTTAPTIQPTGSEVSVADQSSITKVVESSECYGNSSVYDSLNYDCKPAEFIEDFHGLSASGSLTYGGFYDSKDASYFAVYSDDPSSEASYNYVEVYKVESDKNKSLIYSGEMLPQGGREYSFNPLGLAVAGDNTIFTIYQNSIYKLVEGSAPALLLERNSSENYFQGEAFVDSYGNLIVNFGGSLLAVDPNTAQTKDIYTESVGDYRYEARGELFLDSFTGELYFQVAGFDKTNDYDDVEELYVYSVSLGENIVQQTSVQVKEVLELSGYEEGSTISKKATAKYFVGLRDGAIVILDASEGVHAFNEYSSTTNGQINRIVAMSDFGYGTEVCYEQDSFRVQAAVDINNNIMFAQKQLNSYSSYPVCSKVGKISTNSKIDYLDYQPRYSLSSVVSFSWSGTAYISPDLYEGGNLDDSYAIWVTGDNAEGQQVQTSSTTSGTEFPISYPSVAVKLDLHRFYNSVSGAHFYTASESQKQRVMDDFPQFEYEGVAYQVYESGEGLSPVYRFYNSVSGAHFYTASESQKQRVEENYPQFEYEQIAFYVNGENATMPVYRFYNTKTGAHFYTASENQKDRVISSFPDFEFEGIAYYIPEE